MKKLIKRFFPYVLRKYMRELIKSIILVKANKREYIRIRLKQEKIRNELRLAHRYRKIRVAFFIIHNSVWQYDLLYHMMKDGDLFDPVILVIPYMPYGDTIMSFEMDKTFKSMKEMGYSVINSYDERKNIWIDVKSCINPDIIFFTNPHMITKEYYYIKYWAETVLTCYVPYSLEVSNLYKEQYNQYFHNILWAFFCSHEIHKKISVKHSLTKGDNVTITGYPKIDIFLTKSFIMHSCWKPQNKKKKKVIWSPHHTINDNEIPSYSDFMINAFFILDLAEYYKDKIQIAFKPHPVLKAKLFNHPDWGEKRTTEYYNEWKRRDNTQLNENDYMDLFYYSDAIINSSGSFVAEYLMLNKPAAIYIHDKKMLKQFNRFGRKALHCWYKLYGSKDIIKFIEKIVLRSNDPKQIVRLEYFHRYLLPPNNKTASENIYQYVQDELEIE